MIERALGDIELFGNLLHRCAAIAQLIDQARGGNQKGFACAFRLAMGDAVDFGQWFRRPCCLFAGNAVVQDVQHARADAGVILHLEPWQPDGGQKKLLHQHMSARGRHAARLLILTGVLKQATNFAEHLAVGRIHHRQMRFVERAQIAERDQRRLFPFPDAAVELEEIFQQCGKLRLWIGLLQRVRNQHVITRDRAQITGERQIFLLLEVIGDAGGDQADAGRDIGKRHPAHAVAVQNARGGGDDRLFLPVVARGRCRLRPLRSRHGQSACPRSKFRRYAYSPAGLDASAYCAPAVSISGFSSGSGGVIGVFSARRRRFSAWVARPMR